MLINIRLGTIIDIDGATYRVVSAGTPYSSGADLLKLQVENFREESTEIIIFAPVATDSDLGKIRAILEHEEDEDERLFQDTIAIMDSLNEN